MMIMNGGERRYLSEIVVMYLRCFLVSPVHKLRRVIRNFIALQPDPMPEHERSVMLRTHLRNLFPKEEHALCESQQFAKFSEKRTKFLRTLGQSLQHLFCFNSSFQLFQSPEYCV
jgi:hypothetical protein